MPTQSINNFKFGLDSRRSELSAAPGSLLEALDGHINQGGEFEQRKSFVKFGGLDLPATCFGFEAVAAGLVTFGSTNPAPTLSTGVGYVLCLHPTDVTKNMSGIICSCCFGGKAFCVAQFNGGTETYLYYDGTVVPGSIAGLVLTTTHLQGTFSGVIMQDGDKVTIGTQTYRFKTAIAQAYDVHMGAPTSSVLGLANLVKALNGTGVAGTDWYGTGAGGTSGPITSQFVSAVLTSVSVVTCTALITGTTSGSQVVTTYTGSGIMLWSGTVLNVAIQSAQSPADIAQQMFNIMSGAAWSTAGVFVENLNGGTFNIYTSYGVSWAPVITYASTLGGTGTLVASLLSTSTEPINGSAGPAGLTLFAGTTGSISTLNDVAGSATYKLITSSVAFITNVGTTIAALATQANTQHDVLLTGFKASSSTNNFSASITNAFTGNYLQYDQSGAGANLCFENLSLDFSGVASGTSIKNIYVSDGINKVPSTIKYGTGGNIYASPTGGLTGSVGFTLPYGTYLWLPGANDVGINVANILYTKSANPNGVVVTFTSAAPGYIHFTGKSNAVFSGQLILMTDILANAGINYTGAASLTTIAAAIVTAAKPIDSTLNYFVASNTGVSGTAGTTMWLSRKRLAVNASAYSGIYIYTTIPGISPAGFSVITPPSSFGFGSASATVTGRGATYQVIFGGTWAAGDTYQFDVVTAAKTFNAGRGNLTGLVPVNCLTLNDRVHLIAGTSWLGSDNGDATQWDEQAPGAFKVDTSNQLQTPENLTSLAPYQGQLALFSKNTTQIWALNPDPNSIAITQVLANIGCIAPFTAQPLGELDVIFLHSSGARSLRARVASLNAYVTDIGASVDGFISGADGFLSQLTAAQIATACAIVEPNQNRYWLYIPPVTTDVAGVLAARMFVLSYFPSNKIIAWSEYTAAPALPASSFIPIKFVVLDGQVYLRANGTTGNPDSVYVFGGADGITYDNTVATIQIPFYDGKKPGHKKYAQAVDSDLEGVWTFFGSPDWIGEVNQEIGTFDKATFDDGIIPYQDVGTHFSFIMTSNNSDAHPNPIPIVTSFIFYYELGEQPC